VLTGQEYSSLRGRARAWTAGADRALPELVEAFGPPSWWRGQNTTGSTPSASGICRQTLAIPSWRSTSGRTPTGPSRHGGLAWDPSPCCVTSAGAQTGSLKGSPSAPSAPRCWPVTVQRTKPRYGADYPAARTADSMQSADARSSGGCPVQSGFVAWSPTAIQLRWDG
jgi:hypothetical protein